MTHHFTLVVVGMDSADDSRLDAAAIYHDCSIGSREGVVRVQFYRDAPSLHEAIGSAIHDFAAVGIPAYLESIDDADGNPLGSIKLLSA